MSVFFSGQDAQKTNPVPKERKTLFFHFCYKESTMNSVPTQQSKKKLSLRKIKKSQLKILKNVTIADVSYYLKQKEVKRRCFNKTKTN